MCILFLKGNFFKKPVWLSAILYSPLGGVNCPTLVAISGFICFSKKPRFNILEITLGALTLYFGIFGILSMNSETCGLARLIVDNSVISKLQLQLYLYDAK